MPKGLLKMVILIPMLSTSSCSYQVLYSLQNTCTYITFFSIIMETRLSTFKYPPFTDVKNEERQRCLCKKSRPAAKAPQRVSSFKL